MLQGVESTTRALAVRPRNTFGFLATSRSDFVSSCLASMKVDHHLPDPEAHYTIERSFSCFQGAVGRHV
jgi:hypothetical protein